MKGLKTQNGNYLVNHRGSFLYIDQFGCVLRYSHEHEWEWALENWGKPVEDIDLKLKAPAIDYLANSALRHEFEIPYNLQYIPAYCFEFSEETIRNGLGYSDLGLGHYHCNTYSYEYDDIEYDVWTNGIPRTIEEIILIRAIDYCYDKRTVICQYTKEELRDGMIRTNGQFTILDYDLLEGINFTDDPEKDGDLILNKFNSPLMTANI